MDRTQHTWNCLLPSLTWFTSASTPPRCTRLRVLRAGAAVWVDDHNRPLNIAAGASNNQALLSLLIALPLQRLTFLRAAACNRHLSSVSRASAWQAPQTRAHPARAGRWRTLGAHLFRRISPFSIPPHTHSSRAGVAALGVGDALGYGVGQQAKADISTLNCGVYGNHLCARNINTPRAYFAERNHGEQRQQGSGVFVWASSQHNTVDIARCGAPAWHGGGPSLFTSNAGGQRCASLQTHLSSLPAYARFCRHASCFMRRCIAVFSALSAHV